MLSSVEHEKDFTTSKPDLYYFSVLRRAIPIFPKIQIKIKVYSQNIFILIKKDNSTPHQKLKMLMLSQILFL